MSGAVVVDSGRPVQSKSQSKTATRVLKKAAFVDIDRGRWPYCVVWTPIPVLTWFLPIFGHTAIGSSKGIIYDFTDDVEINMDNQSYGKPTKFYQFTPLPLDGASWDKAIKEVSDQYSKCRHSLFLNNCHKYIACVLNKVKYLKRSDWSEIDVWWLITFRPTYTDFSGFARQWLPFIGILILTILAMVMLFS